MDRLSEEVAQASVQTKEKRDRLESARRACQETATAMQAKVEARANSVNVAVAVHHAGCDPRCQGSRNVGTESERADRDGHSTTRTEGRVAALGRCGEEGSQLTRGNSHSRAART